MITTFTPWKRYGHDRLYVSVDHRKIGFRDMEDGTDHPEDLADSTLLTALVNTHLGAGEAPVVVPASVANFDSGPTDREAVPVRMSVAVEPPPSPVTTEPAWTDLALNVPGQAARRRAGEEWESRKTESPVRAVLGRLLNVHTDERAWRIGADGEEHVGAQLEKLARKEPSWRILHALPVGERGSDIDHVAIGPAGVFTINAKHHPGAKVWVGKDQLRVNGHTQPYIRKSRFEATRAAKLLTAACGFDVRADALIILFGVVDIAVKTRPGEKDSSNVHVMYRRQAIRWLKKQPTVLTDAQIGAIYEQARRSTTWR